MGSAPNAAYLEEDTDSYRHLQPPVHYLLDRKLEVDFYGRCEPLVKRHALYDIASMETASTEGHVSQDVVRGDTFMSVDGERLLTVSLPCDEECDTDYENSGSDSTLNRVDTQQGEGNEDAERSLISRIKSVSVNMELVLYMVVFVITNSAQPLLICMLRNKGGAPNGTYTFLIPTYLAMICVGCYPTKKSIWEESWYYPVLFSALDIVHQVIEKAGLIYCGPSMYTIAASTNTMFLAVLSSAVLQRRISGMTWFSISLISASIAVNGVTQMDQVTSTQLVGFALVVLAALVNAFNSIISEDVLRKKHIEGPNLVSMMGILSLGIFSLWSLVFTIPQRHKLFDTHNVLNPFNLSTILMLLFSLFVSNFFRSSVYYYIVKEAGSVCCGVLKAVRIIIVVVGSHALFSCVDKSQTMTTGKLVSSFICFLGVIMYSVEHAGLPKTKES